LARNYPGSPPAGTYYPQRPNNNFFRGLFGGLFGQPQRQPLSPGPGTGQYPSGRYPGTSQYGDLRSRNLEDRRWVPPRQVDPDVPWRDRQRSDF